MTRTGARFWCVPAVSVLAIAVVSAHTTSSQQATGGVEQQVKSAQQKLLQAAQSHDKDAASTVVADNVTWVERNGNIADKQQFLAQVLASGPAPRDVTIDEVRPVGSDVAVVAGVAHMDSGQQFRFLQEWVNQDGDWKLMAHEGTPIGAPETPAATSGTTGVAGKAAGKASAMVREAKSIAPALSSSDQRDVWRVNEDLARAFEKGDSSTYGRLTSDDYIRINADGSKLSKTQTLEMISGYAGKPGGRVETSDVEITVTGDTARGTWKTWGTQPGGEPIPPTRATRIYEKKNGQWQQVAFALLPIREQ
jgi:ketosteroid isomerase-like protein